ncbi:MAG: oligosaccharide flippase family protein [Bacteroidales bacterium]|nr:oligosaccharide flippase family protein [Bacteroidales bacterium]
MPTSSTSRIAKNTLLLYFRMLLTMGVSLYTSRVILNALGIEDYGIYNVVGGVVAMFGILSGSLSAAISRFITFELGKGDLDKLKRIFCTSVNIQVILIAIITILMETVGIWFLNNKMVIPEERLAAANWVFQFSVITFALNLLSVPYNAVIIAHEKMSAFAYISIVDCTLKLIVAFIIAYNPFDRLVYYGLLIMIVGLINRMMYAIYSKRHFEEATYRMIFDKGLMKEMFGFAGWNFIGTSSSLLRDQGGNLLMNLFFGPVANAARGIAMQVHTAVSSFTSNFTTAVAPQITKSYASGEKDYMMKLIFQCTKFSFYLVLLIAQPVLLATSYLLELWLGQIPDYSVNFVRLSMILILCDSLSHAITTAASATGNIKKYQLVVGGCQSLNFPLSYLWLYFGAKPECVFIVAIIISIICNMLRVLMTRKLVDLPIYQFLHDVGLRIVAVAGVSISILAVLHLYFENTIVHFLSFSAIATICLAVTVYCLGCSKSDRAFLKKQVLSIKDKFKK